MRMVGYYMFHTFVNQIRKLFKTWVIIMILACGLLGGIVGFAAGSFSEHVQESTEYEETASETVELTEDEEETAEREDVDSLLEQYLPADMEAVPVAVKAESLVFAISMALLLFFAFGGEEGGGKIFLLADVNLLFSSPMKPQSVLLFRLITRMGSFLFLSVYFGFVYTPMIVADGKMTVPGASMLFAFLFLIFAFALLLQVLVYTISATHPGTGKWIRTICYAVIAILAAGFGYFWTRSDAPNLIDTFYAFGSAKMLRYVPVVGWMKACAYYIFAGNLITAGLLGLLLIASIAALTVIIWNLKADFYEDAMGKSEEVARMQQEMKERGSIFTSSAKKAKKKQKMRAHAGDTMEGFGRGFGASMYFHKAMHLRFRFATFHFVTKTTVTYLIASVLTAVLGKEILNSNLFTLGVLGLGVMVFYRSLGNPLEEDIKMNLFYMIPESVFKKAGYSLLGSAANCAMDLLPGYLVLAIVFRPELKYAIMWPLIIITVNLFATCVGAFIDVSIPISAGTTIKQMIQVMFVYFGLLPDIGLVAIGLYLEELALFAGIASVLNIVLTFVFLLLIASILEPKSGQLRQTVGYREDPYLTKGRFSRIGFALAVYMIVTIALQLLSSRLLSGFSEGEVSNLLLYAVTFAPQYLVGFPIFCLLVKQVKPDPIAKEQNRRFSLWSMLKFFFSMVFLCYAGNILGTLLNLCIYRLFGMQTGNVLTAYLGSDTLLLQVLFLVVIAPIVEELVFRKMLIDRLRCYGEKNAILFSAVVFGLFHGNLTQFIYAVALGLVLAYVYTRSGKLRYPVVLHMLINFMSSVVYMQAANAMMSSLEGLEVSGDNVTAIEQTLSAAVSNPSVRNGLLAYGAFLLYMLLGSLAGLVILLVNRRRLVFAETEKQLPRKGAAKVMWLNPGMIVYILLMIGMMIYVIVR